MTGGKPVERMRAALVAGYAADDLNEVIGKVKNPLFQGPYRTFCVPHGPLLFIHAARRFFFC